MSVSFDPKFIHFSTVSSGSTLLNNLKAYYKLDETAGTNFDDAVGTNDGTLGTGTINQTGKLGKCVSFNNTDYITVPYASITMSGTGESISFWFYLNTMPGTTGRGAYMFTHRHATDISSRVVVATDNILYAVWMNNSDAEFYSNATTTLTTSTWYHVVATNNGSVLKVYVNGADVTTNADTFTGTLKASGQTTVIGNDSPGDNYGITGLMDEVGYWDRALTPTEVTNLYNSGTGRTYPF